MKETTSIYQDMAQRTGGSVYIGVVGPVRTGKSTFVKRFMETLVLPHIDNAYRRDRAQDELPQSGSGRTIMTAEPKFVPEEAVQIRLEEGAAFSVRLVDCVGYMVDSAVGQFEDLAPRMVMTPWFDHEIPMTEAAEIGTRKVITDHATVGVGGDHRRHGDGHPAGGLSGGGGAGHTGAAGDRQAVPGADELRPAGERPALPPQRRRYGRNTVWAAGASIVWH